MICPTSCELQGLPLLPHTELVSGAMHVGLRDVCADIFHCNSSTTGRLPVQCPKVGNLIMSCSLCCCRHHIATIVGLVVGVFQLKSGPELTVCLVLMVRMPCLADSLCL